MQNTGILTVSEASIRAVRYSARGDRDTEMVSRANVQSSQMHELGRPRPGGISDANMGTTESTYVCSTCLKDRKHCAGHPGMFAINYPMISPIMMSEIAKWLRVICFNCGHIIYSDENMHHICGANISLDALAKTSNTVHKCASCGTIHPIVRRPDKLSFYFVIKGGGGAAQSGDVMLRALDIAHIFDRLRDEEILRINKNPVSHPRKFIWSKLLVPSPVMRPDEKRVGGRGSGSNPMTAHLRALIDFQQSSIPPSIPDRIDPKYASNLDEEQMRLNAFLTVKDERDHSVADLFRGKSGILRSLILGKRVLGMGRSTIDGSPRLHLDEISIPLFFAQTLQIMEHVQSFNRARLMIFVKNGADIYPGCSRVIKRNGVEYRPGMREIILEDGDIVMRDLINGDIVAFNRPPTLTISSITAMRIVIDHNALANGMNVLICPFFNADFDGDQMNVYNYMRASSLNEQELLASVITRMVSFTTGANSLKQANDSLVGMMKITQSDVHFDKYHACAIYNNTILMPDIAGAFAKSASDSNRVSTSITGHDLVSLSFAHAPISYRGRSNYYNPGAPWSGLIAPNEACAKVLIEDGKLVTGCLDVCLGAGRGGIYQTAVHEFGPAATLDLIYDHQQIGINYLTNNTGFTTGIRDFLLTTDARERIHNIAHSTLTRANELAMRLHRGTIIPPVGDTVLQAYELMQIATQRVNDSYATEVFRSILSPRTNGIFEMMAIGKGSPTFLVNMMATVGLILISGARSPLNFGYSRALPYFQRFDESPEGRGFSTESFIEGLSLVGVIYNAMMSRTDIISRALFTAVTGDNNRKSEKSLESILTNNYRMATKGSQIVSLVYGGDFYDPRHLETVTYAPGTISRAQFEKEWKTDNEEFKQLCADRVQYRDIRRRMECLTMRDRMDSSIKSPVNVTRIMHTFAIALRKNRTDDAKQHVNSVSESSSSSSFDYTLVAKKVAQFCAELPYLFINDIQRQRAGWIPAHIEAACTYLRMYIRSELASARIRAFMVRENIECDPLFMVAEIIKAISVLIMMALIDPGCAVGIIAAQSFCEPFTQDMLDSYKTSALTGGNAGRIKMNKCREIMAAYNVNKLLAPTMTIILDETSSQSEASARTVAHRIEMLRLSQVVDLRNASIFVEQFGEPVHPDFIGDRAIFAQFLEDNPLYRPPSDLISWCIRFTMNKEMLVQKSITIDVICAKLRETYEDLYFVHTTERADEPIIRVYMRSGAKARMVENVCVRTFDRTRHASAARGSIQLRVHEIYEMLLDTIVRGVPGVNTVRIEKVLRTHVDETDAIVNAPDTYCIRTVGTNLAQISQFDEVNIKWSQTDAVMEIAELLGVEAARARIIIEMRGLVDKCDIRHYMIYADEMTRTGRVTSIERSGLSSREMGNVALRAGQASTVQVFTEAAINARRDVVTGVSGPITYGQIPRLGTLYNNFAIDPAMIRKYKRSARDVIGEL